VLQNVRDYLLTWVAFIIATPTATRAESVDHLQSVAIVSNADGNAWFNAIAILLNSIGVINNPTYSNMRGEVINEGEVVSSALYAALFQAIRELPETAVVGTAIKNFERQRRIGEITTDIQQVREHRDALPNPPAIVDPQEERAIRKALVDGIQTLRAEREQLQGRLAR